MKLRIATIVLDGMPWISWHLPMLNMLRCDWEWHIAEGVSKPVADTAWCRPIKPRLSKDGTTEYLDSISSHPRIKIHRQEEWNGKTEQINACVAGVQPGDVVLQVDSDELWTARQLETIMRLFSTHAGHNGMRFWMKYFVGPDIYVSNREVWSQHSAFEWRRAWLAGTDFKFMKHEPPEINTAVIWMDNNSTEAVGLVPNHYAYALRKQVEFKQQYYPYPNAIKEWEKLQANTKWPCKLRDFFSWVTDDAMADKLK